MQCPSCHTSVEASQRFCPACGTVLTPADAQAAPDAEASTPPDLVIGQTLGGKYKVIRLLGEGGMGAVYEGEQQLGTTKRRVAVKTLHTHLSRDPNIRARFEREVGTVAELEHPNTIQVYDFGSNTDGILYIVMEYLQGKSLANVLEKEGAMQPDRVERIMQQICGSLEEAHGRGIVHRDLKPDNVVLVDRAGKKDFVKVLDFGIAKRSHDADPSERRLTQQGTVLGTPPYMSPEQFTGRTIDARSDIYSLGVMAYEMLTGKLPFVANTPWEWATQHMTQPPIPIESLARGLAVPAGMRSAIVRALSKSPDQRFPTVEEFIQAFTAGTSSSATTPAAVEGRQKTEMGVPLDVAAAFGGASAPRPANPIAMSAGQAPTPIGANVSFPTPAAIPQPPPRESAHGPGRRMLLVLAGLIAVASIAAIIFAVRGSSGSASKEVVFEQGTSVAPKSSVAPSPLASTAITGAPVTAVDDVPPLSGNVRSPPRAVAPHAIATPGAVPGSIPGAAPAPLPTPAPSPTPVPAQSPLPTPAQTPRAVVKYDGPECATARKLRALGHPREAENWSLACTAKGGIP
ncbi:MAG: protein kinase [Myxococcota bacterium]|nr:protein kinase [Myxococcota bacterium]